MDLQIINESNYEYQEKVFLRREITYKSPNWVNTSQSVFQMRATLRLFVHSGSVFANRSRILGEK